MQEAGVEVESFVSEDMRMQMYSKEVRSTYLHPFCFSNSAPLAKTDTVIHAFLVSLCVQSSAQDGVLRPHLHIEPLQSLLLFVVPCPSLESDCSRLLGQWQ